MKKIGKLFFVISYSSDFHEVWIMNWVVVRFMGFKFIRRLGYDISAIKTREEANMMCRIAKAGYIKFLKTR